MKRISTNIIVTVLFVIFSFWLLVVKNGYMLSWFDEMSLFEPGADSFRRALHYPGGVLIFAGTYLTQLLYYPALGAGILILIWLVSVGLSRISFRLRGAWYPFCFLVPMCLLASVVRMDEACLTFESQGFVFYTTLGFTFTIGAYTLYAVCGKNDYLRGGVAVALPLLYPVAGFYALLAAGMCIADFAANVLRDRKDIAWAVITAVLIAIVPQLYFLHFNGTTVDREHLYLKGLPELTMNGYDTYLWTPLVMATILLLIFAAVASWVEMERFDSRKSVRVISTGACVVAMICCLNANGKKSENLRATVLMEKAIDKKEWPRVTAIMGNTKESPNYTMCVLDNLARAYCGRERIRIGNMGPAYTDPRHDENFTITAFVNVPVNHNIGRFNQSHRWATEHNVQYGFRVYFIKYVVLNAIMNGDMEFAKKFNRLLMRTMFHKRWAQEMNKYIEDPSLVKTLPGYDYLMTLREEEMERGE